MKIIHGVRAVLEESVLNDAYVVFDGTIAAIGSGTPPEGGEHIDGAGHCLMPGFIDIHTHGCAGVDTFDGGEAAAVMARHIVRGGVTSFLPTTLTGSLADVRRAFEAIAEHMRKPREGARILGAHMEGPFLSARYKGAHEESLLVPPDISIVKEFASVVKLVTVAPELPGGEAFIRACADLGIVCSIGHSAADFDMCMQAIGWGAKSFTHTFNAMTPLTHRSPGAVGAAMWSENVFCELIADNVHVYPAAQKALYHARRGRGLILVSDALRVCMMMEEGAFQLAGLKGYVKDGRAMLESGTLAGSILTMNKGVKHLRENTGATLWEASRCASGNPAALLGISDKKGRLKQGLDADLVLLDDDGNVLRTYVEGELVYKSGQ